MRRIALNKRLARRWQSLPPRTLRLRLTLIYGGLFLVSGAAVLAITYALVSSEYTASFFIKSGKAQIDVQLGNSTVLPSGLGALRISQSGGGQRVGSVTSSGSVGAVAGKQLHHRFSKVLSTGGVPVRFRAPSPNYLQVLAAGQSGAARGKLLLESAIALAIMALLAMGLGWIVAGRALRPLREITAAAQEISASNLHRRLALSGPDDELRRLGHTFDGLLERLERAFAAQRQFAANVSHELRTPLTYERALIEVALADPQASVDTLREVCQQVLRSSAHQERLVDALLMLSRGQRGIERHDPINLAAVAERALRDIPSRELEVEVSLQPASTLGDERLVERLVANLIVNAVVHNRRGGSVTVATATRAGRAVLSVRNSGPVIEPQDVQRLFEPFERLDGSRASSGEGLGLGLSIVKAIAETHDATVDANAPTTGGLSVQVSFPAASASRALASSTTTAQPDPIVEAGSPTQPPTEHGGTSE